MGISVWHSYPSSEYFCISQIDKKVMQKYGINITVKELKERAKNSKPFARVWTGSVKALAMHRYTKVYRYKDFIN